MRTICMLLACGAIAAGTSAAWAQSSEIIPGEYGTPGAVMVAPYANINPGSSYGVNSTEAGAAGSEFETGNTSVASSFGPEEQVYTGRASAVGAPPLSEEPAE